MKNAKTNHLIHETSPYLLQHANNPVDWYPWGAMALEKARQENKPILLSIGYAACHWCHVMAHESFEDPAIADVMNKFFVNIKIDREERPDVDKIYQTAHYLLTQRNGGWPLTIFLAPDTHLPFFSGTYFPPQARYQLPGFADVLTQIAHAYQHRKTEIDQQNTALEQMLNPAPPVINDVHINEQPLLKTLRTLQTNFDPINAGFGGAPKFPQPTKIAFLLAQTSPMASLTLRAMAEGGIHDQLGGGFFRYAVDEKWRIPHFEKMLYDNGQLLQLYAQAFALLHDPYFADVSRDCAEWVMRYMQADQGGYYASLDADSEGHEGKFYVWDRASIKALLEPDEFHVVNLHYGLNLPANFESEWHFYIANSLEDTATELNISLEHAHAWLQSAKTTLYQARQLRVAPTCDHKILTAWNALMIKGMLTAGDHLKEPRFIQSGQIALQYLQHHAWKENRLYATANLPAYLDDYAFLIDALLTAIQITWNSEQFNFLIRLCDTVIDYFYDTEQGGFYFTAYDHEKLLYRPKTMQDEAIPAGNAVLAQALHTLGHLLGETRYLICAEKTLQASWPLLVHYPVEHCAMLSVLKEYLQPSMQIILRGPRDEMEAWRQLAKSHQHTVFTIPNDAQTLPGLLAEKRGRDKTCAYICQGMRCMEVIDEWEQFTAVVA